MQRHKEYLEQAGLKNATHLEISVYYDKGGPNYFSGGITPRGYFLSVTPVKLSDMSVSFTLFTGRKFLLLETKRFSAKQFAQAVEMSKEHREKLISAVIAESKAA